MPGPRTTTNDVWLIRHGETEWSRSGRHTGLSVADHCLRSRNYVNVIVAGKQPGLQYLDMDAAIKHSTRRRRPGVLIAAGPSQLDPWETLGSKEDL